MSALDFDQVGKAGRTFEFSYAWKDAVLYALGVGAKVPEELDYLYEQRGPKVLPTFAVLPAFPCMLEAMGRVRADLARVLHGEQSTILHRPLPARARVSTTARIDGIYDKGKGALIVVTCETKDAEGAPLCDNVFSIFVRGAGGFGGPRGPEDSASAAKLPTTPPEGSAPDFEHREQTTREQAALYRLSGDLNPLHIDPKMAQAVGFDRPILHGLCTYGIAARTLLRHACEGNPARFRSLRARFSGVVLPGDTLITRGWRVSPEHCVLQVVKEDGTAVLSNAVAELADA
ncbi:MaoC/PaaZ C-terminal domain-containing protein [Haliangium ochraceum]|uniref:3-alpha,7-alpha,12-alpha-trihydroxy-5-beta-chole st-24-enoyl-CoAhydratase n=1 Tax=Haliangium ochraceum (strain DSM 14365 / JCM 11303 / SMP-2) TaxID=502025 RepID=D0LKX7_HALO1|nr:MaoC/PaaZ C-terminal domain-containing protein [Haliangium ochraceum]ACY16697.1 3-alpha,7-alpha,12-alpha-trihydroxy-5-beta-chole st-24-enoyl-CoAhydratase [Haliangium ochraceum DSM 14365]